MKLSKEELLNKVNASTLSDEEKISFMEDISDSFTENLEEIKAQLDEANEKLADITERYKERFLSADKNNPEDNEVNVVEVIDVKEI